MPEIEDVLDIAASTTKATATIVDRLTGRGVLSSFFTMARQPSLLPSWGKLSTASRLSNSRSDSVERLGGGFSLLPKLHRGGFYYGG